MQAVLGFVKDLVGVLLEHGGGDLLAPVGGQAVLHHAARLCSSQQLIIDLIALECLHADFLLGFLIVAYSGLSLIGVTMFAAILAFILDKVLYRKGANA